MNKLIVLFVVLLGNYFLNALFLYLTIDLLMRTTFYPEHVLFLLGHPGITSGLSSTLSDGLRERLEKEVLGLKKEVTDAMTRYSSKALHYYARRLSLLLPEIYEDLYHLSQPHDQAWERHYLNIDKQAERIHYAIAHPAPEESFKADLIYLSARISLNQNDTTSGMTPEQIHDAINAMISREKLLAPAGTPFPAKISKFLNDKQLIGMRRNLYLLNNSEIPTSGDFDKIQEDVRERVSWLLEDKFKWPVGRDFLAEVNKYTALTVKINSLIPIDSEEKVQKLFENAKIHSTMTKKLEKFISEHVCHYSCD